MEHLLLKAATTAATDEGIFEAVISTATVDRDKDIVEPDAMVKALQKWVPTGKLMPLAWGHSTAAADQIGHINPESVKAVEQEVVATGWIDQSTEVGGHAWRLVKSGTLGFSFGYMVLAATKRKGGGLHITELDVFEVSATPIPANGDTRVLDFKSAETLRKDSERLEREVAEAKIPEIPEVPKEPQEPEPDLVKELQEVKARLEQTEQALEDLKKKAEETDKAPEARSVDPLRKRSEELALEVSSDGMSLRTPPTAVKETREPIDVEELRRESRDRMFEVLSYSTE